MRRPQWVKRLFSKKNLTNKVPDSNRAVTSHQLGEWLLKQPDVPVLTAGDYDGDAYELEHFTLISASHTQLDHEENWTVDGSDPIPEGLDTEKVVFLY